ncbi:zinc finger BED domain-containing protein 1-like [Rhizophagus irregularis DAOM 181602=DAOM 197198]|nr:zinc finger BED domain-containing protein 1-like [Rhizophagus irregularis DAOM 181602=DAOM 197198]
MSFAATERNFSTFGFIHNKIRNRLQNERVKKLVYIYGNLQLYEKGLKRKLIHDQCNDNNDNDINNNNNNTGNNNNNDDDDRIFGLKLNIMDLATE